MAEQSGSCASVGNISVGRARQNIPSRVISLRLEMQVSLMRHTAEVAVTQLRFSFKAHVAGVPKGSQALVCSVD